MGQQSTPTPAQSPSTSFFDDNVCRQHCTPHQLPMESPSTAFFDDGRTRAVASRYLSAQSLSRCDPTNENDQMNSFDFSVFLEQAQEDLEERRSERSSSTHESTNFCLDEPLEFEEDQDEENYGNQEQDKENKVEGNGRFDQERSALPQEKYAKPQAHRKSMVTRNWTRKTESTVMDSLKKKDTRQHKKNTRYRKHADKNYVHDRGLS